MADIADRLDQLSVSANPMSMGCRWQKLLTSFSYFLDSKLTLTSQQQKGLLLHHAGHEVQDIYTAFGRQ
jgi:hypothetical protein